MISPILISALLNSCAPKMPPRLAAAIISRESYGNSWAVGDNSARRSYAPKNYQEAIVVARGLLGQHHNIDLGLGQVNSVHLGQPGVTVETMLRPCANLIEAEAVFAADIAASRGDVRRALIAYNGAGSTSPAYANAVIAAESSPFVQAVVSSPLYTADIPHTAQRHNVTSRPRVPALFFADSVR